MPAYPDLLEFMKRVTAVNSHFEKRKNSSLHDLIKVLKGDDCKPLTVLQELLKLPTSKVTKYKNALDHLLSTYPPLTSSVLPGVATGKARAARFPKVEVIKPKDLEFVKGNPPTSFLDVSCEGFLANSSENNGVVLIHLCNESEGLKNVYNGKKVIDHIMSVISVAGSTNTPLCSLYMTENSPVCGPLKGVFKEHGDTTSVFYRGGHMGTPHDDFYDFVSTKTNCVVMGFDGTVCVHANIFGGHGHEQRKGQPAPPLIALTNVITSRAVLSTQGDLRPKQNWDDNEYGVLFGT
jgi:hypothetical protein